MRNKRKTENADRANTNSLMDLLETGIPNVTFAKHNFSSSNHTSGHQTITDDKLFANDFSTLDNLEDKWCTKDIDDETSMLLLYLNRIKYSVHNSSETETQNTVGKLLLDLSVLSGLIDDLDLKTETVLPKAIFMGRDRDKSYFYRVCASSGRPVLVIEAKCPHSPHVLEHSSVKGQITDHMLDAMSFFGQKHIFGITTTLDEFQVHWFPHSTEYAQATTLDTGAGVFDSGHMPLVERELVSSPILRHTDPLLIPTLISVLHKSYHSPYHTVPVIDNRRMYATFTDSGWDWTRLNLSTQQIDSLSLNLTNIAVNSTTYHAIKYFDRDSRAWLAIAQPSMQLVVIKFVEGEEEAQAEQSLWEKVNGCSGAYCITINRESAVCVPLVFHAQERGGRVSINFDLSVWCSQMGAETLLPPQLAVLSQQLQTMGRDTDIVQVARTAIQKCAEQKVTHTDLAWRHVAVLPVFGPDGSTLVGLEPILIDFGRVSEAQLVEEASEVMHKNLDEMIAGCTFGDNTV